MSAAELIEELGPFLVALRRRVRSRLALRRLGMAFTTSEHPTFGTRNVRQRGLLQPARVTRARSVLATSRSTSARDWQKSQPTSPTLRPCQRRPASDGYAGADGQEPSSVLPRVALRSPQVAPGYPGGERPGATAILAARPDDSVNYGCGPSDVRAS